MRVQKSLIIDGNNLYMRAFHAAKASMRDEAGHSTGAVVIFANMLSKYVKMISPDLFVICFDAGGSEYRKKIFPAYKAARVYSPVESYSWGMLKEFLGLAGLPFVVQDGVEADDLIAHYVRTKNVDDKITIVSADKDFLQLLNGWVEIIVPGDAQPWTTFRFRAVYKIHPEHFAKVLALAGDMADNIPGVPRVGIKTAIKFLNKHGGDLEEVLCSESSMAFQRETVMRNLSLVDLVNCGPKIGKLSPVERFNPTLVGSKEWTALRQFLNVHQMIALRRKYEVDAMWHDGE